MSTTHAAAAGIAHVGSERDGRPVVHLVVLPDGPFVELAGSAALIWTAAIATDAEHLVAAVATAAGVGPEAIESQVRQFVADLHDRGLLVVTDDVATLD